MNRKTTHLYELKEKLKHTWDLFYSRYGRFTEIQALSAEPLLEGNNAILVSSTASGKTEAALVPILERHKRNPQQGLSILYITPTRALARDLSRRLSEPLRQLGARMRVKTSDDAGLGRGRLPDLLLTTPESFDSLLANMPRAAKDIRAVILDEIHLLDNTVRGDQLRVLLNRLRRIKSYALSRGDVGSSALQFCAMSATVADPAEVASRYFEDPVVVEIGGKRALDAELLPMSADRPLPDLIGALRRKACRKVLAFCNKRIECEEWADALRRTDSPFGDRIFIHHADLDQAVRKNVERNFSMAGAALCFSTSTLELGIDIGDIDMIALIGPPDSSSSFEQRIGRGSRRSERSSAVCFYRDEFEEAVFKAFIQTVEFGESEPKRYFFRPSIVVQQLFSYVKQTRYREIDPDSAYELFASPRGEPLISRASYDAIVDHMLEKNYFTTADGRILKPGSNWEELHDKRAIYTNLPDNARGLIDVVDQATGRKLGRIGRRAKQNATILFGGRIRRVIAYVEGKLIVRSAAEDSEADPHAYSFSRRALPRSLALLVAKELGAPKTDSPFELAAVVEEVEEEKDGKTARTRLFHCAGEAYGSVLADLLQAQYGVKAVDCNWLYIDLEGTLPQNETIRFNADQVRDCARRRWKRFEEWFELGSFQAALPPSVRLAAVAEAFGADEFVKTFSGRRIVDRNQKNCKDREDRKEHF